jgi:cell division protein FtsL
MYEPFFDEGVRWQRYAAAAAVILMVAGLVFLYLWLNSKVIILRRDLSTLSFEIQDLEKEVLSLEYRVSKIFSPERLEEKAREFGMVPLSEDHIIRLQVDVEGDRD